MRDKNDLTTKLWLTINCILKAKGMNHILNPKNILTNVTKVAYVISMFAAKKVINMFKKNIVFNIKST